MKSFVDLFNEAKKEEVIIGDSPEFLKLPSDFTISESLDFSKAFDFSASIKPATPTIAVQIYDDRGLHCKILSVGTIFPFLREGWRYADVVVVVSVLKDSIIVEDAFQTEMALHREYLIYDYDMDLIKEI